MNRNRVSSSIPQKASGPKAGVQGMCACTSGMAEG